MRVGIIGAGFIGRAVAGLARRHDHDVMISNSCEPRTLGSTVALGCKAGTAQQAAEFGEAVVVAIPFSAYRSLPVGSLSGKPVLDANNYYPQRDGHIAELDQEETTTSEMLAAHLAGARVAKACNGALQQDLAAGGTPPERRAGGRCRLPETIRTPSRLRRDCTSDLATTSWMLGR